MTPGGLSEAMAAGMIHGMIPGIPAGIIRAIPGDTVGIIPGIHPGIHPGTPPITGGIAGMAMIITGVAIQAIQVSAGIIITVTDADGFLTAPVPAAQPGC